MTAYPPPYNYHRCEFSVGDGVIKGAAHNSRQLMLVSYYIGGVFVDGTALGDPEPWRVEIMRATTTDASPGATARPLERDQGVNLALDRDSGMVAGNIIEDNYFPSYSAFSRQYPVGRRPITDPYPDCLAFRITGDNLASFLTMSFVVALV